MTYQLMPEPEKPPQPSLMETIGEETYRIPAQAAAAIGSALPGVVGNLGQFLHSIITGPAAKVITGEEVAPYEQTPMGKAFPTTQTHLKNLQEGMPFLIKPKNKFEKFTQDIVKDAADMYLGGKSLGMGRYAPTPLRSAGTSIAAHAAGKSVEALSGDEQQGDKVKNGTMLALSLFNPTSAKNITQNLYQNAQRLLPQNATIQAGNFSNYLNILENKILQGRPIENLAPSERFVIDQINSFRNLIQNNNINMHSLVAQRRSFHEILQKQLYEIPNRAERARAKELAQGLSRESRNLMRDYGRTNPEWWRNQSRADQAFGTIAQSNFISRGLEGFLRGRPEALSHVFGVGIPAGLGFFNVGAGIGTAAAYQAAKLGYRIFNSPELRNHYAKVVGAALAENPEKITKELDQLQNKVQETDQPSYTLLPQ